MAMTIRVIACAATAVLALAPMAHADQGTPIVADNCGGQPQVRPQSVCLLGDNTWNVDNIIWKSWGSDGAKGTGIEFRDNCVPDCARGSAIYSPVTIALTGATPPDFRYTSAVVTNQNTHKSDTASPLPGS